MPPSHGANDLSFYAFFSKKRHFVTLDKTESQDSCNQYFAGITLFFASLDILFGYVDNHPYIQNQGVLMRGKRAVSESNVYHVLSRGVGKQVIFEDEGDRYFFLKLIRGAMADFSVELYAWCLMGNHFHMLVHANLAAVSNFQKDICGKYAQVFNKRYERTGHLFQERFKSEPINTNEYLMAAVRYIHENPAKAGIGETSTYPWSSYQEYAGGKTFVDPLCKTDVVLSCFGGLNAFLEIHRQPSDCSLLDVDVVRSRTRPMPDDKTIHHAKQYLGEVRLESLNSLPKPQRDSLISGLLDEGLSHRQIERFTGISKGIIQRAKQKR